jgi:hypothetical protein
MICEFFIPPDCSVNLNTNSVKCSFLPVFYIIFFYFCAPGNELEFHCCLSGPSQIGISNCYEYVFERDRAVC